MFTTLAKLWKQPKYPSIDEEIDKQEVVRIHTHKHTHTHTHTHWDIIQA